MPGGLAYIHRAEADLTYPIFVQPQAFGVLHSTWEYVGQVLILFPSYRSLSPSAAFSMTSRPTRSYPSHVSALLCETPLDTGNQLSHSFAVPQWHSLLLTQLRLKVWSLVYRLSA